MNFFFEINFFNFQNYFSERRGNSPGSSAGSDNWGGDNNGQSEGFQNWESKEFKKSGWDEPDSSERFNAIKKTRKQSDGDQWDTPRQGNLRGYSSVSYILNQGSQLNKTSFRNFEKIDRRIYRSALDKGEFFFSATTKSVSVASNVLGDG